ncbi:T9SS type A sorting domain-containing protein [Paradesertivirga mongoliensis]|uniref:T9SS type A sorting domain-containing protein n=1 Tax=Paradesertivirga mongoliensis TaxID=2100740 RepID=A0ABW4ZS35_9SPHI|nr:T9SS type A sorting domain-containing protein [Pedobacter mongoliensis]
MKKFYSLVILFSFLLMSAHAAFVSRTTLLMRVDGITDSAKKSRTISKITDTRPGKPSEIKSVKLNIIPFKPTIRTIPASSSQIAKNASSTDSKILSNVKIYPNPVADHLNLSYFVNKDSNVIIKIMDILGNEVTTLLSQRLAAGEQINSFPISSSLNSGYYFVRIIVGGETIVKRISVL